MVKKHQKITQPKSDKKLEPVPGLAPNPELLIEKSTLKMPVLKKLVGQNIVSVDQFDKELILEICKFSAILEATEIAESHPLDGKIAITAFFEASTRTRLSFESAVMRLDGKIISIPDGKVTGTAKGESMYDIGEMFNAYGDVVIVRHTETDAIYEMIEGLRIPLVNAGNGSGEHPTQAMADWYALLKWKPHLKEEKIPRKDRIHLGILGTPGSMRAVKSFLKMALFFKNGIKEISIVSEMADPLGADLTELLDGNDVRINIIHNIEEILHDLDVVYMNSIAFLGDSYKSLDSRFKLKDDSRLKKDAVVLHPLARLDELSPKLDETHHNLYFTQAHGAVFVRQALLIALLNRFDRLPENFHIISK